MKRRQGAEERKIIVQMSRELGQIGLGWLNVGEGDHRGGSTPRNEHRKAVDKVAHRGRAVFLPVVGARWQNVQRNCTRLFEVGALFRLGFQILVVEMCEYEIEHVDAS